MDAKRFFGRAAILLTAAFALIDLGLTAEAQQPMGAWQPHRITFDWLGDVTSGNFYTCPGLRDALTFLLKQSGARLNTAVEITPCSSTPGGATTLLSAKLDFSTFTPADNPNQQGSALPGSWRSVQFSASHSFPALQQGDCELVLEFSDRLLKYFATRDSVANLRCIPFQEVQYGLVFETFVPSDTPARAVGGH